MKFLKGQSNDDLNKFYKFDTFYRDQSLAWKWVKYIANINDNKHAFLLRFTDNRQVDKLTSWRYMLPPPPPPDYF